MLLRCFPANKYWIIIGILQVLYLLLVYSLYRRIQQDNDPASINSHFVHWETRNETNTNTFTGSSTNSPYSIFQALDTHWIYTAYYDARKKPVELRVLALVNKDKMDDIFHCHFKGDNHVYEHILAKAYEMNENHRKDYGGWILSCGIPHHVTDIPETVAISVNADPDTKSYLNVSLPVLKKPEVKKDGFGLCVPPVSGVIKPKNLIEFLELTFILGASHIMVYVERTTTEVHKVLNHYQQQRKITIIPWNIPLIDPQSIWNKGQLLAVNDCLYRYMSRFKYLMFNDLDEFLVPHAQSMHNWDGLVSHIEKVHEQSESQPCGYSFRSAFYDPVLDDTEVGLRYDIESDLRIKKFSSVRKKCLVIPEAMYEMGIHHMSQPISEKYQAVDVAPSVGYVHHFRECITDYDKEIQCRDFVRDESLAYYFPSLRQNVNKTIANGLAGVA